MFREVLEKYKLHKSETKIPLPATEKSAGWDLSLKERIVLPPFGRTITYLDVKCELSKNEVLFIIPRSSLGIKKGIMLQNTIGVIDADYFENEENDGNIAVALFNTSNMVVNLEEGERVAQGVILLLAERQHNCKTTRKGGLGHTGVK